MKQIGIVSEFNPFHFGHEYLIRSVKEKAPDRGIVCVMSGNFVQRGSFAIQEKYSRAACAVKAGADLVLEIPFPFSSLSAEAFAKSAVSVLQRSGIVSSLAFGTECGDGEHFFRVAEKLSSPLFRERLKDITEADRSLGYPEAREALYAELYGEEKMLSLPNASLALEYVLAAEAMDFPLELIPVTRKGEGYHSTEAEAPVASATALRRAVFSGEEITRSVPDYVLASIQEEQAAGRFPVTEEKLSQTLLYLIQTLPREELSSYYGFASVCDRAKKEVGGCESISDLAQRLKSRNVTDSRIRRGLLAVLCRIPRFAEERTPSYTLVLAANERGRQMLSEMREKATIPVFTKPAHALKSPDEQVARAAKEAFLAEEIYSMAMPRKAEEGFFLKQGPRIL